MINIVCMKTGDKYGPEYVNNLQAMVARNLKMDFKFYCITDDCTGISPTVKLIFTTVPHEGWWNKLTLFSSVYGLEGTILYLDLDIVVVGILDELCSYGKGLLDTNTVKLLIIQDWWQKLYNSSVMMFRAGTLNHIYKSFLENEDKARKQNGDQNWITQCMPAHEVMTWPKGWMLSYKTHIQGINLDKKLHELNEYPGAKIVVFHGNPKPHQVDDKFVRALWYE